MPVKKIEQRRAGRPVALDAEHRRIAAIFRSFIQDGGWKVGSVVPSLHALSRELHVSYGTVRQAVDLLKREQRLKVNAWRRLVVARQPDTPMDGRDISWELRSGWTDFDPTEGHPELGLAGYSWRFWCQQGEECAHQEYDNGENNKLDGRESKMIYSIAPSPGCKDFRVKFIEAN